MEERLDARFTEWLATAMRGRRMSHEHLALRSGVHHSTISRLLSHKRRPSLETALKLAAAIGPSDGAEPIEGRPPSTWLTGSDPVGRVERALRADERLTLESVRRLMELYHELRRDGRVPVPTGTKAPGRQPSCIRDGRSGMQNARIREGEPRA